MSLSLLGAGVKLPILFQLAKLGYYYFLFKVELLRKLEKFVFKMCSN
jgi:hypothetical protein